MLSRLSLEALEHAAVLESPVANAAYIPGADAQPAPPFHGLLRIHATALRIRPALADPRICGRDVRLFPDLQLEFFTLGDCLIPRQRGQMLRPSDAASADSYWCAIAQIGRIWREPGDQEWSRAAFPIMLVNDTENHAHQGLALFLYQPGRVSALMLQFTRQSSPYLIAEHFVAWGSAPTELMPADSNTLESQRARAQRELMRRLPARAWPELLASLPPGTLDGFDSPSPPRERIAAALVFGGTLYFQNIDTPYGPYPYPLEMRFGVRSVTKGIFAPLALLHLAERHGSRIVALKIGDYLPNLDPKWRRVRFLDAANMASGFGGGGSTRTDPNDFYDGYLEGDYDAWYLAPSTQDKLQLINTLWPPYPWEPGTVLRYRDQDFFVLGVALDALLKSLHGADAELGAMLTAEVFGPLGIEQVPMIRTRETGGHEGTVCCNAGYYPTLDDLAKIALLYQCRGEHAGVQILHRSLTEDLLAAHLTQPKSGAHAPTEGRYGMGLHFLPWANSSDTVTYLPSLRGSGENEVILYPKGIVSIVMSGASARTGLAPTSSHSAASMRAVTRLARLIPTNYG
jgi:CubicO group peptidase (beta-lactamase class C family)